MIEINKVDVAIRTLNGTQDQVTNLENKILELVSPVQITEPHVRSLVTEQAESVITKSFSKFKTNSSYLKQILRILRDGHEYHLDEILKMMSIKKTEQSKNKLSKSLSYLLSKGVVQRVRFMTYKRGKRNGSYIERPPSKQPKTDRVVSYIRSHREYGGYPSKREAIKAITADIGRPFKCAELFSILEDLERAAYPGKDRNWLMKNLSAQLGNLTASGYLKSEKLSGIYEVNK